MASRSWTLRRTLVVGTSVLVAAALLVSSLATVFALRSFMTDRLDEEVVASLGFAGRPGGGLPGGHEPPGDSSSPPDGGPAARVSTLQAVLDDAGAAVSAGYTGADGAQIALSEAQIDELATVPTTRTPSTIDLGGDLGSFRVAAEVRDGHTVVTGIAVADVEATTGALTAILLSVGAGTLVIAVVGLSLIVRRNLRPLERVATVAQRVSGRRLADGTVHIPERVDARDTDPATEVGRVGTSLNELLGHVEAALSARQHSEQRLRRFIADASHELRTPLASIRGYAQLSVAEGGPMTPTQERSFDRISAESVRMGDLVDDLLLLARLDAGQLLRRDDVELTLLAVDAVSDAQAVDAERAWRLDVPDEDIIVPGDENRLRQVLANLLRNARTHTPPGTTVTTTLRRDGGFAVLSVLDDGPGIDPAVRGRLFDRFARGDDARNRDAGSTGLGLSIAHAITAVHGGRIDVASAPGRTRFTVRLPLDAPQA